MYDQPRYDPLESSSFFSDNRSARPLVAGTVPRGAALAPSGGATPAEAAMTAPPVPVTLAMIQRGRQRYDIFCAPCHDRTGSGNGMVVQRGYRPPTSFHADRLREAPVGHFYDVMTRGLGAMPDYAQAVPPEDRWAIAVYVKALQVAQRASIEDVPSEERTKLETGDRPRFSPAPPPQGKRGGNRGLSPKTPKTAEPRH